MLVQRDIKCRSTTLSTDSDEGHPRRSYLKNSIPRSQEFYIKISRILYQEYSRSLSEEDVSNLSQQNLRRDEDNMRNLSSQVQLRSTAASLKHEAVRNWKIRFYFLRRQF